MDYVHLSKLAMTSLQTYYKTIVVSMAINKLCYEENNKNGISYDQHIVILQPLKSQHST